MNDLTSSLHDESDRLAKRAERTLRQQRKRGNSLWLLVGTLAVMVGLLGVLVAALWPRPKPRPTGYPYEYDEEV